MKFCWHDWEVWQHQGRPVAQGIATSLICAVALVTVYCLFGGLVMVLSFMPAAIFVGLSAIDIAAHCDNTGHVCRLRHVDRTCLKCGKSEFGYTAWEQREEKRKDKVWRKRKEFDKKLEMYKKANS